MRKCIIPIFFILSLIGLSYAGGDAMFGLQWLSSPQQVRNLGVTMVLDVSNEDVSVYTTDSLPKNHSMAETYNLVFYKDSTLVKIVMSSKNITDDLYGTEGKEKFQLVYDQIAPKNKPYKKICYSGQDLYDESDEFYQCLEYKGCGNWVAFFQGDNKAVMLELKGLRRGTGYLKISAEASPEWSAYLKLIKEAKNKSDKGSF